MTQENEKSSLTYDDRRKILKQKKTHFAENKTEEKIDENGDVIEKEKLISTVNQSMEVDYTEEGIKLAYKNLSNERTSLEKRIADLKVKVVDEEMPEDLKELRDKLNLITKYTQSEKEKAELVAVNERLIFINNEINEIKKAIGDRLKL